MKTTKLFFMAALALTFAACSNDDNDIQNPAQPAKAEGIHFTATINIDQNASTRALTENGDNIEATWADGEKVALIYTVSATTYLKEATVTPQSDGTATISATLDGNPEDDTDVTIVYPASAVDESTKDVKTDLLASQNGLLTGTGSIAEKYELRKTPTPAKLKIDGLTASLKGSVSLTNQNAIFKFTLGSAIDATHPLTIKDDADNVITTVTPTASMTDVYVAMAPATSKYYKFSATTAENKIISKSSTATIAAGKYYHTTLACPALGDLYYSDGTYSTIRQTDKSAIGVIAYLGTDNFTENGTNVSGSTFVGHGLVLCLKNAASGSDVQWSTDKSTLEFGDDAKVTSVNGLKRTTNVSGYTNTKTLVEKTDADTKYKAAYAAKNYTGLAAPTGTTGWFLPSAQQWVKMQEGLGGLAESTIIWNDWYDKTNYIAGKNWDAAIFKVGSADRIRYGYYLSSSEYSASQAVYLNVDIYNEGWDNSGFKWETRDKNSTSNSFYVRPILAF